MLAHLMGYADGRSLLAVAGGGIVGHAMYAGESGEAEMAIVAEDGWRSMGIGKLLLAGLPRRAAGRGNAPLTGEALGGNRRVPDLVDAVFVGSRHGPMHGTYHISMPLGGLRRATRPAA